MLEHDIGKCVCVKNSCSIPLDFIVIFWY
jgi:hypothetical protein